MYAEPVSSASHGRLRPSLTLGALPPGATLRARLQVAVDAGFEGLEVPVPESAAHADDLAHAAHDAGLTLHLVRARHNHTHPFSSRSASDISRSVASALSAITIAQRWGSAVQLVLGAVPADMALREQFSRGQHVLATDVLPAAVEAGVTVVIENVWRDCFTTPERFADFVDGLNCPRVGCLFDTGNVFDGHPEDWLPVLGHRILRLHTKDFRVDMTARTFAWPRLGDGQVRWDRVRAGLEAIGYSGWATCADNMRGPVAATLGGVAARAGVHSGPLVRVARAALEAHRRRTGRRMLVDVRRRFARYLEEPP